MKCASCEKNISRDEYCVCGNCKKAMCRACAEKNLYVCPDCLNEIQILS